jgi:hypothetical protein
VLDAAIMARGATLVGEFGYPRFFPALKKAPSPPSMDIPFSSGRLDFFQLYPA